MKFIRITLIVASTMIILGTLCGFISYWWIEDATDGCVNRAPYTTSDSVRVALLLGTSRGDGSTLNRYYTTRITAAVAAYRAHKIQKILVSGDNSRKDYDEPTLIKLDLINAGIPADSIVLDYAGFDTYDSMIRARDVFGVQKVVVISQEFHCNRAIFIGQHLGMQVTGLAAQDPFGKTTLWMKLREAFARTKAVLDVTLHSEPHFRGERIII